MSGLKMIYTIWRVCDMYNETKGFVKGISAGLVAGLAVASVSSKAMKSNRQLKRTAGRHGCRKTDVKFRTVLRQLSF